MNGALGVERLGDTRCQVGESPLWAGAEQALYWVDIEGRRLHRCEPRSAAARQWAFGERLACLALHGAGGLLCALESTLVHAVPGADASPPAAAVAGVAHAREGMRFNDGRCDRAGRFWVGSMVMDMALAQPAGVLYRFDGKVPVPVLDGLLVPNGLGFSPDGRTMYLSDSHPAAQRIWAFDLDDEGLPSQRRLFVDMRQHPGRPDGAAVDAEGCYWTCANDAGLVHRFTPQGRLDRSIAVPVSKPSMCAFGGPRLDELYITTIRPAAAAGTAEAELAGATFVCRPGVQGLAETPFAAAGTAVY